MDWAIYQSVCLHFSIHSELINRTKTKIHCGIYIIRSVWSFLFCKAHTHTPKWIRVSSCKGARGTRDGGIKMDVCLLLDAKPFHHFPLKHSVVDREQISKANALCLWIRFRSGRLTYCDSPYIERSYSLRIGRWRVWLYSGCMDPIELSP